MPHGAKARSILTTPCHCHLAKSQCILIQKKYWVPYLGMGKLWGVPTSRIRTLTMVKRSIAMRTNLELSTQPNQLLGYSTIGFRASLLKPLLCAKYVTLDFVG
jgi:hypothetical protein